MKITKKQLKQIIKEEIEAALELHQESLEEITPEMIAQFAWEDGIRIIDFGDPDKEPKLDYEDKKHIAKMIADEAGIEIDMWGDAVDRNITLDFIKFKDKVFTALWHIHDKERKTQRAMAEAVLNEDGKGCADTDKGCIRKRKGGWVILNNKKGGVWRKCDSRSHCEEILDAFHASKG